MTPDGIPLSCGHWVEAEVPSGYCGACEKALSRKSLWREAGRLALLNACAVGLGVALGYALLCSMQTALNTLCGCAMPAGQ